MTEPTANEPDLNPDTNAPAAREHLDCEFAMVGILGEGVDLGTIRVYVDTEFKAFYEVPRDKVRRRERLPAGDSPLGVESSVLYLTEGTPVRLARAEPDKASAEFLAGEFAAAGENAGEQSMWEVTAGSAALYPISPTRPYSCSLC